MEDVVSIIIPIYNVELYLFECLLSIKKQTYVNLEIILINDGSTDSSADICKEFVSDDNRFKLISTENKGLGMARNKGIDIAGGEYICFVDADDFIHEAYIEILLRNLKEASADISICNYIRFSDKREIAKSTINNKSRALSKIKLISYITTTGPENKSEKVVVAWNKLIRRELFNNLRFVNKFHEDEFMITELITLSSKTVWTDDILYFYRQPSKSIMGEEKVYDIRHLDHLDAVYQRIQHFSGEKYKHVFQRILCSYFDNSIITFLQFNNSDKKKIVRKRVYPRYMSTLLRYFMQLPIKKTVRYSFFLISPSFYRKCFWEN
ncbi:MAG: glycosyltransferase family 2 protein [Suipraeoptans sp.]